MKKIDIEYLIKEIKGKTVCRGLTKEAQSGYCGDFLSFAISRMPVNAAWFTVMNNANVAGVAQLAEAGAIIICENIKADNRLKECCQKENITLIETPLTVFECAVILGKLLE